jgi:hypothetical protein
MQNTSGIEADSIRRSHRLRANAVRDVVLANDCCPGLRENFETEIAIGDMRIHRTNTPNYPVCAGRKGRHQGDVKQGAIAAI